MQTYEVGRDNSMIWIVTDQESVLYRKQQSSMDDLNMT